MRLVLTGRHLDISPGLRALVNKKLARLERTLGDAIVSAQVVCVRHKDRLEADVSLHMRGDHVLAGKTAGDTWVASVGRAVEKIEQQASRVKGKWAERKRRATSARTLPPLPPAPPDDGAGRPRVVRALRYHVKPLTVDDAALEVEGGQDGFLVFRNAGTGAINVLYRRKNGDLALIEPER